MIKQRVKQALVRSGILRLAGRFHGGSAALLMYHSVLDDPNSVADSLGGMVHSQEMFRGQMELLARHFRPVNLDEVAVFARGEKDLPQRSVVVTFDDGYVDNLETAMPILDRVGVPATFYVTVDSIQNRRLPWPSRLRFSFRRTPKSNWIDETGKTWNLGTGSEREQTFLSVCDRVAKVSGAAQESLVRRIEKELECWLPDDSARLMMTWDQVRALTRNGHIVGSHTMTHPNMAFVSLEDAHREFAESKQQMEAQLNTRVTHFSYPCPALYPNWTEQTIAESRSCGYETAVTTSPGTVHKGDNPLALSRVRPTKTVDGLRWNLEMAFAGRAV